MGVSWKLLKKFNIAGVGIEGGIGVEAKGILHYKDSDNHLLNEISFNCGDVNPQMLEDYLEPLGTITLHHEVLGDVVPEKELCYDITTYGILRFTIDPQSFLAKITGDVEIEFFGKEHGNSKIEDLCFHIEDGKRTKDNKCTREYRAIPKKTKTTTASDNSKSSDKPDDNDVTSDENDDYEATHVSKRKVSSVRDYTGDWSYIYEYDSNGNLVKLRYHNGIRNVDEAWWIYEYKNGVCTSKTEYSDNAPTGHFTEYTYDGHGRLIYEYALWDGLAHFSIEYTYSNNDKVLTKKEYEWNSEEPIYTTTYEYDKAGFCIIETYYQQNRDDSNFEGMTGWKKYEYNSDHTSATAYTFSSNGTRSGDYTLYTYDKDGNCLTSEYYNEDGELDRWASWKYTYTTVKETVRY